MNPDLAARIPGTEDAQRRTPSWYAAAQAEFNAVRAVDLSSSEFNNQTAALRDLGHAVTKATGAPLAEALAPFIPFEARGRMALAGAESATFWRAMDALRASLPPEQRGFIWTQGQFADHTREKALERYYANADIAAEAPGAAGASARFAGGAAAAVTDPLNIASMLAFRAPAGSILKAAGYEAAINAGAQASIEPFVQDYRGDLGLQSGLQPALRNIGYAAGGGAVFGGAGRALEKGIQKIFGRASDEASAAQVVADHDEVASVNPFADDLEGVDAHFGAVREAGAAAATDSPPPPAPPLDLKPETPATVRPQPVADLVILGTDDLTVDASAFQFKEGGDEFGVTERLRDVTEWRPERANVLIAYERADGVRVVADGHQRFGLARRIRARDPSQNPSLPVYIFREADGYTPAQVKAVAAMKNIAEGTGSPLDAARILRGAPELARGLPEGEAFIKTARGLAALSDEAFDLAARGIIPELVGGAVGRAAPDRPELHVQLAQALKKLNPRGVSDADFMAKEMLLAPTRESTTADLFGEETIVEMLIKERAEIRQAAIGQLAKDRRAFETLVRERDRLEAEGNRLEEQANRNRVSEDLRLALAIEKDAQRAGPIADALGKAANALRDGAKKADAVRQFIDAVKGRTDESGGGRARAGGARQSARSPDRPAARTSETPTVRAERLTAPEAAAVGRQLAEMVKESPEAQDAGLAAIAADLRARLTAEDAPPLRMVDPDTGAEVSARDLFADIDAADAAVARLKGCVV